MSFTNIVSKQTNQRKGAEQKVSITVFIEHICLYAPQNVYSKSAYHTTMWLLQCTTAYKFTGVQRLPRFRLPDASD